MTRQEPDLSPRGILKRLENLEIKHCSLERPLKIGDRVQMLIMDALNGNHAFCDACLDVPGDEDDLDLVGRQCPCGKGVLLPGAAMEPRWRKHVGLKDIHTEETQELLFLGMVPEGAG